MYVAQPIEWTDHGVVMLDQRRLPTDEIHHTYTDYREVAKAIRDMVIRGAPAIGVAAAMGVALGVHQSKAKSVDELRPEFAEICDLAFENAPYRRRSLLGARTHESTLRRTDGRNFRSGHYSHIADRRSSPGPSRKESHR